MIKQSKIIAIIIIIIILLLLLLLLLFYYYGLFILIYNLNKEFITLALFLNKNIMMIV